MAHVGFMLLKIKNTCFLNLKPNDKNNHMPSETVVSYFWRIPVSCLSKVKKKTALTKYYRNSCEVRIVHWNLGTFL